MDVAVSWLVSSGLFTGGDVLVHPAGAVEAIAVSLAIVLAFGGVVEARRGG